MKIRFFFFYAFFFIRFGAFGQTLSSGDNAASFDFRNMVPGMPENSSLGAYGNIPMNTSSGIPNISFNLYTLSKDGVSVPINISYLASGIKYSDIPSCLGLKWTLDCGGSINRSINGFSDESYLYKNMNVISDSAITSYANYNTSVVQSVLGQVGKNAWDFSLDNYYYSLPNGRQGEMYFNAQGKFLAFRDYAKLNIQVLDTNFLGFKITDESGTQYFFQGGFDQSSVYHNAQFSKQSNSSAFGTTAWKLSTIVTPNKKEIHFEYATYDYGYWTVDQQKYVYYNLQASNGAGCGCAPNEVSSVGSEYTNIASLLTRVYSDDAEVDFSYSDNPNLQIWQRELSNVAVLSRLTGDTIKKFTFNYNASGVLELNSYSEVSRDSSQPIVHSFHYNGTSGLVYGANPATGGYTCNSLARDIFGYFNNEQNTALFSCSILPSTYGYPLPLASRSINPVTITNGTMDTIYYPTGGKTAFTYEPNTDTLNGTVYYAPGIRVKEMKDMNGDSVVHDKLFVYKNMLGGMPSGYLTCYESPMQSEGVPVSCTSLLFYSEFNPALTSGGYYYARTTTTDVGPGGGLYTRDYYSPDNNLYGVIKGLLTRTEYYKNDTSTLVQAKDYNYAMQIIDSESTSSYILAPVLLFSGYYALDGIQHSMCNTTVYQGVNQAYNLRPMLLDKIGESTITYGPTGTDSVVATKNYHYYPSPRVLQSMVVPNSDNKIDSTVFSYSFNFPANPVLNAMTDSNMVDLPVEQDYYYNQALLKKKLTDFKLWNSRSYMPDFESLIDVPSGKIQNYHYYNYDTSANLLEAGKDYDMHTSYIWDYIDSYPIAEVTNGSQGDIAYTSFEADGSGNWTIPDTTRNRSSFITGNMSYNLNGTNSISKASLNAGTTYVISYWIYGSGSVNVNGTSGTSGTNVGSWTYYEDTVKGVNSITVSGNATIDELRLFPQGSLMTTYTYSPLIGMTSQCTPASYITYYGYDGLGRLANVKDLRGNVIKTYNYHYQ